MVKIICDRCGAEINGDIYYNHLKYGHIDSAGAVEILKSNKEVSLCETCMKEHDRWVKNENN